MSERKAAEGLVAHLARGHGELPVPALGIGMAVDADVVGRIEEGRVDPRAVADHRLQEREIPAVAAADAVLAQDPDVAGLRARRRPAPQE